MQTLQNALRHIIDIAPSSDLITITVNFDILIGKCLLDKRVNRSLANLAWPINIEGPHDDRRQIKFPVIGVSQMFTCEFADRVCPPSFTYRTHDGPVGLFRLECVRAKHFTR